MDENKQIEEMACAICGNSKICCGEGIQKCLLFPQMRRYANNAYKEGYRKQNEPISCGHENGEWVQLPCKVGDTLYVISQMKDKRILPFINEYEVTSIDIKRKSIVIYHEMDGYIKSFKQTDFGKTIFLTREEAEAKMKGGAE